jgi:uncharacterized protein (DUF2062 family)
VNRFFPKGSTTSLLEAAKAILGLGDTPGRTAVGAGLGVAIGLLPLVPFQTALALLLAFLFRLNRPAVLAGTLVWQPFTAPAILAAGYGVGRLLLPGTSAAGDRLAAFALGASLLAAAGGVGTALGTFLVLRRRARRNRPPSVLHTGGQA